MIIYKVTNLINGKVYIGQTSNNLAVRKGQHFREAEAEAKSKRRNLHFHNALNKYGEDNFLWEEIDSADTQKELDDKERYWIQFYDSMNKDKGYNLESGGKTGGVKSDETKIKIGETTKDKWANPDTAKKMRDGLTKATETWIMICEDNKIEWECPICHQVKKYVPWELKNRQTCSTACAAKLPRNTELLQELGKRCHLRNVESKQEVKTQILEWAKTNRELVLKCPYNKIVLVSDPLLEYLDVHDIRSLFVCFEVKNKKEFLKYLKNYLTNENIC